MDTINSQRRLDTYITGARRSRADKHLPAAFRYILTAIGFEKTGESPEFWRDWDAGRAIEIVDDRAEVLFDGEPCPMARAASQILFGNDRAEGVVRLLALVLSGEVEANCIGDFRGKRDPVTRHIRLLQQFVADNPLDSLRSLPMKTEPEAVNDQNENIPGNLPALATAIRNRIARTRMDVLFVSDCLRRAKDKLRHGQFQAWVDKQKFGFGARTARDYISFGNFVDRMKTERRSAEFQVMLARCDMRAGYILGGEGAPADAVNEVLRLMREGKYISETEARSILAKHAAPKKRGSRNEWDKNLQETKTVEQIAQLDWQRFPTDKRDRWQKAKKHVVKINEKLDDQGRAQLAALLKVLLL